jgi:hypothetical protein
MTVSLDARFQDAAGIVDPARVSLEAQEHLLGGGGAVNTVCALCQRGNVW